jgi:hypothetical protein
MIDQIHLFVHNRFTKKSREIQSAQVTDARTGQVTAFKVRIGKVADKDPEERGVLKVKHKVILNKLLWLWMNQGYPTTAVEGDRCGVIDSTAYFLARFLLNVKHPGKEHYTRLANLLLDLHSIPISFDAITSVDDQRKDTYGGFFTLIQSARFEWATDPKRGNAGKIKILFHSYVTECYYRGEKCLTTKLLEPFCNLQTDIAKLLYDFLDRILAGVERYEKLLADLIVELDLSEEGYGKKSERKKLFMKPVKELCGKPLSCGKILFVDLQETKDGSDWKLVATTLSKEKEN